MNMLERMRLARGNGRLGAALLLPLWLGSVQSQEAGDTVFLKDGSTETGTVSDEIYAGLVLQPEKGGKKTIPWDKVQSVEYADAPPDLGNGLAALNADQYEDALARFQALLAGDEKPRPMIQQQALFFAAYAQQRAGQLDQAIAGYQELLKAFPQSRFLRSVGDGFLSLYTQKGDLAGAKTALDALEAGTKDQSFAAELAILRGILLLAEKMPAEARAQFEAAEKATNAPASVQLEARLWRARTLVSEGKRAEAEPIFSELKGTAAAARVQSGAWNGLGELWAEDGRSKRDGDRILDGLYAYLRTVVQYEPLLGEPTDEYERALAGSATCFKYISELEQNNERKKLYAQRSRERLDQLQKEFPGSAYLQNN